MTEPRHRPWLDYLPLAVFLLMGVVTVAARSLPFPMLLNDLARQEWDPYPYFLHTSLPVSLRLGGTLLFWGIEQVLILLGHLAMIAPDRQPLFLPPPSEWPVKWSSTGEFQGQFAPLAAHLGAKLLMLVPILLVVRRFHLSPLMRGAHLLVVLVTLAGWPPVLVSAFYTLARKVIDWPLGYYNFGHELLMADFAAIAFVHLLILVLAAPGGLRARRIAAMAVLGQLCFENLGFITGVAAALAALGRPMEQGGGRRPALRLFLVAGFASAPVLAGLVALKLSLEPLTVGVDGYFLEKWTTVARQNFQWIKLVIAHGATMAFFPLAFAGLLGWAARRGGWTVGDGLGRSAVIAVTLAGLTSILVGSLFSGFFPDMGRQIAFFLTLLPSLALVLVAGGRLNSPPAS